MTIASPIERFRTHLPSEADHLSRVVSTDTGEAEADVRPAVEHVIALFRADAGWDDLSHQLEAVADAACRAGVPRLRLLDRYLTTGWVIWDVAADLEWMDREALRDLGGLLLRGSDLCAAAIGNAYVAVDRELAARDAEARRSFLEELLGAPPTDPAEAGRLRRLAARYGVDPDVHFKLIAISPPDRHLEDTAPNLAAELTRALASPSRDPDARPSVRLPLAIPWRTRVVVIARGSWPGIPKLRETLSRVVGESWIAISSPTISGVANAPEGLAQLVAALRTAERIGHTGWVNSPDDLAIEELLLVDEGLMRRTIDHELGPILAEPRMGEELVETLRVYFDSGENMRETARRLHLANRTVAYRLERIEHLLGGPLDGPTRQRLSIALLAYRILHTTATPSPT